MVISGQSRHGANIGLPGFRGKAPKGHVSGELCAKWTAHNASFRIEEIKNPGQTSPIDAWSGGIILNGLKNIFKKAALLMSYGNWFN